MRRLRSAGCAVLLAGGAIGATLLAAEVGLRLLAPQPLLHDPDAFIPDPALGARLRPGFTGRVTTTEFSSTWVINSDGYRGPRAGARGPAAHRILALGDSFTFGYGVEEDQAWPRVMEARLNERRGAADRVEVLNLGVGGYGTWQEALWLEEMAPRLHPDLAVVAFYVGNDPADNARARPAVAAADAERETPGARPPGVTRSEQLKRWLGSRLHLYALVSSREDELLVRLGLRQLVYPFEMEVLLEQEPPEVSEGWRLTRPAFARLADFSRRTGLAVIVAVIPMKHQVSDRFWERVKAEYDGLASAPHPWDRDRPQRTVASILSAERLPEIDLLERMREAARAEGAKGDGSLFYWPRDQHWSARGHAEAASLIAAAVAPALEGRRVRGNGSE